MDTDWAVSFLTGHTPTVARLRDLRSEGLALSIISLAELYEGVTYSRDPAQSQQRLNDLLETLTLLGIDEDTCQIFGKERGRLRAAAKMIGDFDLLIGATARQHNLTLLSNYRRHFEAVEGLRLLSL